MATKILKLTIDSVINGLDQVNQLKDMLKGTKAEVIGMSSAMNMLNGDLVGYVHTVDMANITLEEFRRKQEAGLKYGHLGAGEIESKIAENAKLQQDIVRRTRKSILEEGKAHNEEITRQLEEALAYRKTVRETHTGSVQALEVKNAQAILALKRKLEEDLAEVDEKFIAREITRKTDANKAKAKLIRESKKEISALEREVEKEAAKEASKKENLNKLKQADKEAIRSIKERIATEKEILQAGGLSKRVILKNQAAEEQRILKEHQIKVKALTDRVADPKDNLNAGSGAALKRKIDAELERELRHLNIVTDRRIKAWEEEKRIEALRVTYARGRMELDNLRRDQAIGNIRAIQREEEAAEEARITRAREDAQAAFSGGGGDEEGRIERTREAHRRLGETVDRRERQNKSFIAGMFKLVGTYELVRGAINGLKNALLSVPAAGVAMEANLLALSGAFGTTKARQELEFVGELAVKIGANLGTLEASFTKFAPSALLAGASLEQVNQIFEDFSLVGTVLHKTPDQMQSIFVALEQMFAKGVIQSEELKKQLGNQLPAAVAIFAEGIGKTPAQLMKAMKANLLITKEYLPKIAAKYREIFASDKVIKSLDQQYQIALNRVSSSAVLVSRQIYTAIKSSMVSGLKVMGEALEFIRDNLSLVGFGLNAVISLLSTRFIIALANVTIATLGAATANIRLAYSFMGLSGAITAARYSLVGFLTTVTGLNPYALAGVVGITAIGSAMFRLSSATVSYSKSAGISKEDTKALYKEFEESDRVIKNFNENSLKATKESIEEVDRLLKKQNQLSVSFNGVTVGLGDYLVTVGTLTLDLIKITTESAGDLLDASFSLIKTYGGEIIDWVMDNVLIAIPVGVRGMLTLVDKLRHGFSFDDSVAFATKDMDKLKVKIKGMITEVGNFAKWSAESTAQGFSNLAKEIGGSIDTLQQTIMDKAQKRQLERIKQMVADLKAAHAEAYQSQQVNGDDLAKTAIDKNIDSNAAKIAKLNREYANLQIGITEYYTRVKKLREEDTANIEASYKIQIEAANRANEVQKASNLVRDKRKALEKVEKANAKDESDKIADLLKFKEAGDKANLVLLELQGNMRAVADLKKALVTDDERGAIVNSDLAPQLEETIRLSKELQRLQEESRILSEEQARREAVITSDVAGGLESILGAMIRTTEAKRLYIQLEQENIDKMREAGNVSTEEIAKQQEALDNYKKTADETSLFIRDTLQDNLAGAFHGFITGADSAGEAMKKFATGVIDQVARIAANQLAQQIIGGLFTGVSGVKGVKGVDVVKNPAIGWTRAAKGSAISGLTGMAGQVVSNPTLFPNATPMANGGVLAGEAGAEVILPLKRNSNGVLGVSMNGGGASGTNITIGDISVTVQEKEGTTPEEQSQMVGKAISLQVRSMVAQELTKASRKGNALNKTGISEVF